MRQILLVGALAFACASSTESHGGSPDAGSTGGMSSAQSTGGASSIGGGNQTGGSHPTGGSTNASTTSAVNCSPSSEFCMCLAGSIATAGDVSICSASSENGVCCAGSGYPTSGSCTCMHWLCAEDATSCDCSASPASGASSCKKSWTTCCMNRVGHFSTCMCDNFGAACDTGWTKVSNCAAANMQCDTGESSVSSCKG